MGARGEGVRGRLFGSGVTGALQVLKARQRTQAPWPKKLWWALGLSLAFLVLGALLDSDGLKAPGLLLALTGGVWLGFELEERLYIWLNPFGLAARVFITAGAPVVAVLTLILAAVLGTVLPNGLDDWLVTLVLCASWWAGGAAVGTALVLLMDRVVSGWVRHFRTRLTVALVTLVFGTLSFGAIVATLGASAAAEVMKDPTKLRVDAPAGIDGRAVVAFLTESPWVINAVVFAIALLAALPSLISACSKLADAAMERLHPMAGAFQQVSSGSRDVRVEVGGSVEFADLATSFNTMVEQLSLSERMESAFGRYVSGHVLERIRAQHGEAEIPAQLKDATVFFADIRGFTRFSEKLAPTEVVTLLNRYLARVVDVVNTHDGYLNKFIGDAVVVVFNGPMAQPDHAARAVACAKDLQKVVDTLNAEGVNPEVGELRVGVGIATGPMVAGNVGGPRQMEYTVIGDTVNLSARLTSLAGAGEIWVSDATRLGATAQHFEALPEVKVKGREQAVIPWKVS